LLWHRRYDVTAIGIIIAPSVQHQLGNLTVTDTRVSSRAFSSLALRSVASSIHVPSIEVIESFMCRRAAAYSTIAILLEVSPYEQAGKVAGKVSGKVAHSLFERRMCGSQKRLLHAAIDGATRQNPSARHNVSHVNASMHAHGMGGRCNGACDSSSSSSRGRRRRRRRKTVLTTNAQAEVPLAWIELLLSLNTLIQPYHHWPFEFLNSLIR
jgi:hypothetical protein